MGIETRHIITCDQCIREELEVRSEWAGIKEAKAARWDHHSETGFWCPFCREAARRRADLYKDPQAAQGPINEIMRQLTPDEMALHRREAIANMTDYWAKVKRSSDIVRKWPAWKKGR